MWKTLTLSGALVCALAVTAAAQGGVGQSMGAQGGTIGGQGSTMEPAEKIAPAQGTVQSAEKGAAKKPGESETLTGCLQKGNEPTTFTLANASKNSGLKLGSVELVGAPAGLNLEEHLDIGSRETGQVLEHGFCDLTNISTCSERVKADRSVEAA